MSGSRMPWLVALLLAVVAGLVAGGYWVAQQHQALQEAAVAPAPAPAAPVARPQSSPPPAATPPTVAAPTVAAPTVAAKPTPPSFDVVRVAPDGAAVIAGRAQPGAEVVVKDGATELGRVTADARGEWALVPTAPLKPGTRELTLTANLRSGETVESDRLVVLAIPAPGQDLAGAPAPTAAAGGTLAVATPRAGAGAGAGAGASTVLQKPEAGQAPASALVLDAIDYDEGGEVVIAGHAPPGASVRIYLDGKSIGSAVAEAKTGVWQLSPDQPVAAGVYSLRVDQLSADGKVKARIESPFARAATPGAGRRPGEVVVQPGNSLWRIAHATYGEGTRYTVIYQANREQIRDPDLIYPGQVFALPPTQ